MKTHAPQSKNGIMTNFGATVKIWMIVSFCKFDYILNPSRCDCEYNKACKIGEYLDIKNCLCKKRFFGKLVLAG